ncbi:hypothetical protein CKM354_000350200 [Cercospora kikuchii]|uniref:Uncharacterized protein n=1 Tax=Cercospora kikuchii TaxID=84275 RepID=A0A9P3CHW8_9PEZI|nr:uncharacterized protein CKM354_000350200 [Cercospora kikuchii]GIZ40150.1 hypothetical protein CKM354_000350200 [Cercospora kikuchii]
MPAAIERSRKAVVKPRSEKPSTSLDGKAVEALITEFTQGKKEIKAAYNGLNGAIKKCKRIQERIEARPSEHDDYYYNDYRPFQAFLKNITTAINALNDEIAEMHQTADKA